MQLKRTIINRRQAGYSLLEALVGATITVVGLIALAQFQGKLSQYSSTAKQRTVASSLAEQQLENLKTFSSITADGTITSCDQDPDAFDAIVPCTGGVVESVGNFDYTVSWEVTEYYVTSNGVGMVTQQPTGAGGPDIKHIEVAVTWAEVGQPDANGVVAQGEVILQDLISKTPAFNSGRVAKNSGLTLAPSVAFDIADFPDIMEIGLGQQKLKASTTPTPQVTNQGDNVVTNFDVITYLNDANSGRVLSRREEFRVVSCVCEYERSLPVAEGDFGREPLIWDGEKYAGGEADGTKLVGSAVRSGNLGDQPEACDTCCRDHHDGTASSVSFDPFRPSGADNSGSSSILGDHAHFNISNGQLVQADPFAGRAADRQYLEVCRMVRKNGFFGVATDIKLGNIIALDEGQLSNNTAVYGQAVVDFVASYVDTVNLATYPATTPQPSFNMAANNLLFISGSQTEQLAGRALYIDYMSPELVQKIKCLRSGQTSFSSSCDPLTDPSWLEIVPFYDLDVTNLANWQRAAADDPVVEVTSDPISNISNARFSRGEVGLPSTLLEGVANVEAYLENSNSGLTDTNEIDPDDQIETNAAVLAEVIIGATPPQSGVLVDGAIAAGNGQINIEGVALFVDPPGVDCSLTETGNGNNATTSYSCDMEVDENGLATGEIIVSNYNTQKKVRGVTTVLDRKVCPGASQLAMLPIEVTGIVVDDDGELDETTTYEFTQMMADLTIDITIVEQADSCP